MLPWKVSTNIWTVSWTTVCEWCVHQGWKDGCGVTVGSEGCFRRGKNVMPSRFICHGSLSTASPDEIETRRCLNCNRLTASLPPPDSSTHLPAERFRPNDSRSPSPNDATLGSLNEPYASENSRRGSFTIGENWKLLPGWTCTFS